MFGQSPSISCADGVAALMAIRWGRGLFLLWVAFAVWWIAWTSWRTDWSGLDVFVPTTREECETKLGRNRLDDLFARSEVDECMKRGAVEMALRKSYKLEKLAFILTPPLAVLVAAAVVWFGIWLIIRCVARLKRGSTSS